ncbi:pilus assembly protein [Crenobacter cavernae]|uniref:PilY1 beta-propeller domain-containing protein n=1 Tax=Crenobacter cavernae TaxID=2290923 RepID=A0ABY0FIC4_9NEIS|nr:PilC/PilY family type IV pilus protein [Crenobacter cavernae]RXZ45386.1 hypothetical protein EBB06_00775 [Crenobacter cavernae]
MHAWKKNIIALSIALWLGDAGAASQTLDEIPPGVGVSSAGPNVLFALSIEFPTAGEAYTNRTFSITNKYIGYFDPDKCYGYNSTAGYFEPVAAVNDAANRTCDNSKWSGNLLNWATMSAVDIFRSTLTGGSRALGTSGTSADYTNGDTTSLTVLRRARIHPTGQNRSYGFSPNQRNITSSISSLTPHSDAKVCFASSNWTFSVKRGDSSTDCSSFSSGTVSTFNAMVKVCDATVGLEANCTAYTSGSATNYKPEGLIQKNGTKMRFGAFSYLNDPSGSDNPTKYNRDGGVLRARLKKPGQSSSLTVGGSTISLGAEWNSSTGQFVVNPDSGDATASSVASSGVVNYINKFGDNSYYKTYDPAAELYYAALRYYRNKGNFSAYTSGADATMRDGFPAITNWDDPIVNSCQKNFIIYLGDTNTHGDVDLPGSNYSPSGSNQSSLHANPPTDDMNVASLTSALAAAEGVSTFASGNNTGSSNSPPYIAALAYWGNTNDIRTDTGMDGKQTVSAFMIDTVENNQAKCTPQKYAAGTCTSPSSSNPKTNPFYVAAKYGGFIDSDDDNLPDVRSEWTSDAAGTSSIAAYSPEGTPKNFAQANSPQNMENALNTAFSNIQFLTGSLSTVMSAVNGATLRPDGSTVIYRPSFTPSNWTGDLSASVLAADGSETLRWSAAAKLNASVVSRRNVFTYNRTVSTSRAGSQFRSGTGYEWLATALNKTGAGSDSYGAQRIDYIRGDKSREGASSNPVFRSRAAGLFGTVINSAPVYIPAPGRITETGCDFPANDKAQILARAPMVAVSANDGMLHVVNANDSDANTWGQEVFSYVPASILPKLRNFTDTSYTHNYLVDGPVQAANICTDESGSRVAKTVLVGSTGAGGKGVFALDVTKASASSGFSASDVLWEFSDADDTNLGYAVASPQIVRVRDGSDGNGPTYRYAALLGNGLNSTGQGGSLFLLYLDRDRDSNGGAWVRNTDYRRLDVGQVTAASGVSGDDPVSPNGLMSPMAVDEDGDLVTDWVYAGDVNGNLWKFDLRDANPANWAAANSGQPLFTAWSLKSDGSRNKRQPVVAAPLVVKHPKGGLMVVFGTGKLFSGVDREDTSVQALYGLRDNGSALGHTANASLVKQTIAAGLLTGSNVSGVFKTSSANTVDYTSQNGWYMPLTSTTSGDGDVAEEFGERALSSPGLIQGRAQFVTTVSAGNSCTVGGESWLTELNVFSGAQLSVPIYDTSGDGVIGGSVADQAASRRKLNVWSGAMRNLRTSSFGMLRMSGGGVAPNRYPVRINWREIMTYDE